MNSVCVCVCVCVADWITAVLGLVFLSLFKVSFSVTVCQLNEPSVRVCVCVCVCVDAAAPV